MGTAHTVPLTLNPNHTPVERFVSHPNPNPNPNPNPRASHTPVERLVSRAVSSAIARSTKDWVRVRVGVRVRVRVRVRG